MAVTLNTSANSTADSFSYTMGSGTNGVLVAIVDSSEGSATSVTYNGVNMTNLGTFAGTGSIPYVSLWVMYSPPSGTHTLAASTGGILAASYFGVSTVVLQQNQQEPNGVTNTITFNVGSALNANSWYGIGGGAGNTPTAGTGTTKRQSNTTSWDGFIGDSNGAVGSGSFSMSVGMAAQGAYTFVLYEIEPQTNNTVTPAYGSLALTGESVNLLHGTFHSITTAVGTFTLTGIALAFTLFRLWVNQSKHSTSFSNSTKHSAPTFTNQTKHSSIWVNKTKDV